MACGDGQGVGGVEGPLGVVGKGKHGRQKSGKLLLGRRSSARNAAFHYGGRILRYRQPPAEPGAEDHALGSPELEHGLHVFAKKGRLNRYGVGLVPVQKVFDGPQNVAKAFHRLFGCRKLDAAQVDQTQGRSVAVHDPKAHYHGARVDS